jgi:hemoglobin-like flavoprotein
MEVKAMDVFQAVQESFDRCGESERFYDTFYDVFLAKSPEIPPLFARTDFKKQKLLLKATVTIMVRNRLDDERARRALERVAETHSRKGLNIRPDFYELWLDSLCETVQRHDRAFTPELERQWRLRMREGIDFIVARY